MYITQIRHYLNEKGEIPTTMPKEARELASFLSLVVDTITITFPSTLSTTDIRCFNKGCFGEIKAAYNHNKGEIHWYCPECENEAIISNWEGTKFDNRGIEKR